MKKCKNQQPTLTSSTAKKANFRQRLARIFSCLGAFAFIVASILPTSFAVVRADSVEDNTALLHYLPVACSCGVPSTVSAQDTETTLYNDVISYSYWKGETGYNVQFNSSYRAGFSGGQVSLGATLGVKPATTAIHSKFRNPFRSSQPIVSVTSGNVIRTFGVRFDAPLRGNYLDFILLHFNAPVTNRVVIIDYGYFLDGVPDMHTETFVMEMNTTGDYLVNELPFADAFDMFSSYRLYSYFELTFDGVTGQDSFELGTVGYNDYQYIQEQTVRYIVHQPYSVFGGLIDSADKFLSIEVFPGLSFGRIAIIAFAFAIIGVLTRLIL